MEETLKNEDIPTHTQYAFELGLVELSMAFGVWKGKEITCHRSFVIGSSQLREQ